MKSTHRTRVKAPNDISPTVDADASDYDDALPPILVKGAHLMATKTKERKQLVIGQSQTAIKDWCSKPTHS